MNKLKLVLLIAGALFVLSSSALSQTLYFCEGVDDDGYPINESSTFNIGSGGGYLYFLVRLPYEVDCYSIRYEIYKVDRRGKESYDNTIYQDTEKDWVWFWKEITFYDSGNYNVYVYDCYDYLLASNTIKINFR